MSDNKGDVCNGVLMKEITPIYKDKFYLMSIISVVHKKILLPTDCPKPNVTFTDNGTKAREVTVETDPNFVSAGYVPGDTFLVLWWLRAEAFDKENGRCFLPCRLDSFKIESIPISNAGTACSSSNHRPLKETREK